MIVLKKASAPVLTTVGDGKDSEQGVATSVKQPNLLCRVRLAGQDVERILNRAPPLNIAATWTRVLLVTLLCAVNIALCLVRPHKEAIE